MITIEISKAESLPIKDFSVNVEMTRASGIEIIIVNKTPNIKLSIIKLHSIQEA